MLNSSILDVAIGLVFCFAGVALFVSSVNEVIAAILKSRHRDLFDGVKWLLNNSPYVVSLYNHALINPLLVRDRSVPLPSNLGYGAISRHPAYISSENFARALTDVIGSIPQTFGALETAVNNIADPQLKEALQGFLVRSNGDITRFESQVADWFDSAMDRLSGVYKRKTQGVTFLIGFIVALLFNIDACHVLSTLWERPGLAAAVTSPNAIALINHAQALADSPAKAATAGSPPKGNAASQQGPQSDVNPVPAKQGTEAAKLGTAGQGTDAAKPAASGTPDEAVQLQKDVLGVLGTLPIGWTPKYLKRMSMPNPEECEGKGWSVVWERISFLLGILITASTAVFGAPFWFDLLQRLIQVRSTGTKPLPERDRDRVHVPERGPDPAHVQPTRAP
jgi:hypothetical protein